MHIPQSTTVHLFHLDVMGVFLFFFLALVICYILLVVSMLLKQVIV